TKSGTARHLVLAIGPVGPLADPLVVRTVCRHRCSLFHFVGISFVASIPSRLFRLSLRLPPQPPTSAQRGATPTCLDRQSIPVKEPSHPPPNHTPHSPHSNT